MKPPLPLPARRLLPWFSILAVLSGCAGWGQAPEAAAADLRLEPMETEGGWYLVLVNSTDHPVRIGCGRDFCPEPLLRLEAQQEDGSWVERQSPLRFMRAFNQGQIIYPGSSLELSDDAHRYFTGLAHQPSPGIYRAVLRVHPYDPTHPEPDREEEEAAAFDVSREFTVVGWDGSMFGRANEILGQATEAECFSLLNQVDRALIQRLEPDPLIEMYEQRSVDSRDRAWVVDSIRDEMIERGGFVPFLTQELTRLDMDVIRRVADQLHRYPAPVQEPLRAVVTERLTAPLRDLSTALPARDYQLIESFDNYWPPHTAERLVERLERGPESGEGLVALLNTLAYSSTRSLDAFQERVLAALPDRCVGHDPELAHACDRVRARYRGALFGRGFGTSSACGGSIILNETPTCRSLRDQWEELSGLNQPETIWLGS